MPGSVCVAKDVTEAFLAAVSAVEARPDLDVPVKDKKRILRAKRPKDTFELRARDVSSVVSSLRNFLLDNRGLYLGDGDGAQEDDEYSSSSLARDKIDAGAASHISTCQGLIRGLRSDVRSAAAAGEAGGEMRARHLEAVCTLLEAALKSACSVYAELKAIRVQKEVEFQRLSRLEFKARKESESGETLEEREREIRRRMEEHQALNAAAANASGDSGDDEAMETEEEGSSGESEGGREQQRGTKRGREEGSHKDAAAKQVRMELEEAEKQDDPALDDLTAEEVQMLEQENEALYADLVSVRDAVQQVESKVVRIAELQEIFTEKVMQQSDDVDVIARNAVTATENVKDGNEEIRKAIQNQASIRVYVLFFLLVMSFSLLFLDWYND